MRESALYRKEIEQAAARHDLDPNLVEAIVVVESSGLTHAYRYEPAFWSRYLADDPNYKGANPRRVASSYGLMQIMYPTAREHGFSGEPEMLFMPAFGLHWGCLHYASLLKAMKGDIVRACSAYNGGLGRVRGDIPPDLRRYANKVINALALVRTSSPAQAG